MSSRRPPSIALGEQVEGLFTIFNRTAAAISRRVAAFDRGRGCAAYDAHSTAAWLRQRVRLAPNAASEQVRVARQLDRHPEAGRAFAAGEVGFAHAQVITRLLEDAPCCAAGRRPGRSVLSPRPGAVPGGGLHSAGRVHLTGQSDRAFCSNPRRAAGALARRGRHLYAHCQLGPYRRTSTNYLMAMRVVRG